MKGEEGRQRSVGEREDRRSENSRTTRRAPSPARAHLDRTEHNAPAALLLKGLSIPSPVRINSIAYRCRPLKSLDYLLYKGPARREQAVDSWSKPRRRTVSFRVALVHEDKYGRSEVVS